MTTFLVTPPREANATVAWTADEQHRLEQFYYYEAALLDSRKYDEWLALFSDDCRYWMPIRQNLATNDFDKEFTTRNDIALFDDDKAILTMRAEKLKTGYAWAEEPPSRTRHNYNNIRVLAIEDDEIIVEVNFSLYRSKHESEVDWWVGRRVDVLRRDGHGKTEIIDRSIYLDQTVVTAKNLSVFF